MKLNKESYKKKADMQALCDSARLEIVIVESIFVIFTTQKQRKIKTSVNVKILKKGEE